MNLHPTSYTKVSLRWINGLNVKSKTLKLQKILEKIPAILEKQFFPPLSKYFTVFRTVQWSKSRNFILITVLNCPICRPYSDFTNPWSRILSGIMLNFAVVSLWSLICNTFSAFFVLHEFITLEECKIVTLCTLPWFQFIWCFLMIRSANEFLAGT